MRLKGLDAKGDCVKSWCFYLQAPPEDNGAKIWNGVTSFFTAGNAGSVLTRHYA